MTRKNNNLTYTFENVNKKEGNIFENLQSPKHEPPQCPSQCPSQPQPQPQFQPQTQSRRPRRNYFQREFHIDSPANSEVRADATPNAACRPQDQAGRNQQTAVHQKEKYVQTYKSWRVTDSAGRVLKEGYSVNKFYK